MDRSVTMLVIAAILLNTLARAATAQAEVQAYPPTTGIEPSGDYRLWVANKEIFVYRTPACSMAAFAMTGGADVVVQAGREIRHAVVRPLARGIKPVVQGANVVFHVQEPCQLAIEVDDDLCRPLFLFVNPIERDAPRPGQPGVTYFDGGRIHDAGTIELKSGQTIYIAGGAIVRGVIRANQADGARIIGPGMLDASTQTKQIKTILLDRCRNVEIDGIIVAGSYGWSVVPRLSENVRIRNMKVVGWRDNDDGCDPDSSRHVIIDHCFFRTQDDCIAVKSHDNAGNANGPPSSDPHAFDTDDVRVSHCVLWNSELGHALTVGFAVRGPAVQNVVFEHCDVIKKIGKLPALSIDNHDLGAVSNVRFDDIRIEDGCERLLAVKVAFSEYSADCPIEYYRNNPRRKKPQGDEWARILQAKRSTARGTVRGVLFKNIQVSGIQMPPSDIRGWSERNEIADVVFENVRIGGKMLKSLDEMNLQVTNATAVSLRP